MDENFRWRASLKTDEQLHECINNREKLLPETVEAAVAELQFRGEVFDEDELRVIEEDMEARRQLAKSEPASYSLFSSADKNRQIDDPEAPAYYSKKAIYAFSILFSVFFGSILMAINVGKTPSRNYAWLIILYGMAFTGATILVAESYNINSGVAIIAGILGAYPLNYFFWGKYIGHAALYRVKPIWIPLAIAAAFIILFFIVAFYSGAYKA